MSNFNSLEAIETLRRRLESIRHDLGSMSDYLDRGNPTPEEVQKTKASMLAQKAQADALESELIIMVNRYRQEQPELIVQWVAIHQAIFQELNAYFEAHQEEDVYNYRLEKYVTAKAIEEWEKVKSGEADFVINNSYVMKNRQAIIHKHFGF